MINYTTRLDKAIRISARAHEKQGQHRKGTDIPYIIHPFGVMLIASNVTKDENVLIGCLMHDILEDIDSSIYNELQMKDDFGDKLVGIVKDVTKDDSIKYIIYCQY
jgi:(p)ppGpp synthase/HD superfamily hydrolase